MNILTPHRNLLDPKRVQEEFEKVTVNEALFAMRKRGWRWKVREKGPIPEHLINEERKNLAEHRVLRKMRKEGRIPSTGKRHVANMSDFYIRKLIRESSTYDGHEITKEEMEEKRKHLASHRKGEIPHFNKKNKKTFLQKRDKRLEYIKDGIENLKTWYVKNLIRDKIGPGIPISDEMVKQERERIMRIRQEREKWPVGTSRSEKLTDNYVIYVMKKSPGYSTWETTPENIRKVRASIIKRRERNPVKKKGKEPKQSLRKSESSKIMTDSQIAELLNSFI